MERKISPLTTPSERLGFRYPLRTAMQNTEKRILELIESIDRALDAGVLTYAAALALRGRMQFANFQVWGRASKVCLKQVTMHAYGGGSDAVDAPLAAALSTFKKVLNAGKPKEVVSGLDSPFFIFTDASFEPADSQWPAGLRGVLYDEAGAVIEHFSYCLSSSDLELLGFPQHKQTVIFETEVLAITVALQIWRNRISNRPVVIFVDNNSARDVAVSGSARTKVPLVLVSTLLALEDELALTPWYARVPSKSNPADEPSRSNKPIEFLGARIPCSRVDDAVRSILSHLA